MAFKFKLNHEVIIEASGECGVVVGRAEYADGKPQYLIRYMAADGRAVEQWWNQSALTTLQVLQQHVQDMGTQSKSGGASE
ncbi:hypothetical protein IQ03_04812 [Gemmobacter caeni]|uniref:Uncharacterized protein n=1 Tax=Gemmobacter caeni TaxID=589035 RepID=A0A2T6AZ81_9RHOB|nr:hypothetical protein [Gemmobacter caeni]PTX49116.1 hypothetical protein C8N34_108226 [Gemmobacter caeni]TWI93453.1 hypothetical protein IQ03_04812 [Gemmobacter caeni]